MRCLLKQKKNMSVLKILGSGSEGNGYIIECTDENIVIELGMPFRQYVMATDISKTRACLVSHKHGDHFISRTAERFMKFGVPVMSNADTTASYTGKDVFGCMRVLEEQKPVKTGCFTIRPIRLEHSADNYGYIITHQEFGKLVFATDTTCFPYKIKNIDHLLIEANYSPDIVIDGKLSGKENRSKFNDHLSIKQSVDAIAENVSERTKNIVLIHLSDSNSDASAFCRAVTGIAPQSKVYIADPRNKVQEIYL